jgi:hypothetical protein
MSKHKTEYRMRIATESECNSKRYIRPYSDYRLAVLCSLNNKPIRDKMERYLLRSEYGSKY